jgi:hypothetical protein
MKETFRYPLFYTLQPILGMLFVVALYCVLLVYRRRDAGHDWVALIGFSLFVIFVMWKGLLTLRNRLRDPLTIDVNDAGIRAIHRSEKAVEMAWKDIATIETKKDRWRPGFEIVRITSRVAGIRIECNNQLGKYNLFKTIIMKQRENQAGIHQERPLT